MQSKLLSICLSTLALMAAVQSYSSSELFSQL